MTINLHQVQVLQPIRLYDEALMSSILHTTLTKKEIQIVNNTRLFLQITYIAEIATQTCNSIHQEYVTKEPPKQRPNRKMWRVWKKSLTLLCRPASWILQTK
jgi:hypothetical protein